MRLNLQQFVYCFFLLSIVSCSPKLYYGPDAINWEQQERPDTAGLVYTVYLLGDAGAPKADGAEPTFKLLKQQLDQDPNSTLIVLGDNLYHEGLAAEGAPGRKKDEQRLNEQIGLVADHKGKVFFIPGNHDWDYMGAKGLEKVRRQEQYIEEKINKGNTFVPDNGCPGPFSVSLHNEVVFIAIDSHWWLHKHIKPYGRGSGCDAVNETEMLQQIEQILAASKDKHIVVSAHHPFISNSNHGGFYNVMDHLFPLRLVRDGLYIPLPVIGSLYPFFRRYGGVDQDIPHYRYQQLINQLTRIFIRYDNIIFAAGHDHNLQLHKTKYYTHIISGSGCKTNYIEEGNDATFIHREKGFVKVLYYANGDSWAEFWSPEGTGATGRVYYRGKLYNKNTGEEKIECAPVSLPDTLVAATTGSDSPGTHTLINFLIRKTYKQEWKTPVDHRFLNLGTVEDGLSAYGITGTADNYLLRFKNAGGYEYSFRPVLRNPLKTVPAHYRGISYATEMKEIWIPSQHPYAPLVVGWLEQETGLPSHAPRLYLMPDAACLGVYRDQFKNKLGYLAPDAEEYHREKLAGYAPLRVLGYNSLIQELEQDHRHQPDRRAFAKARLLDMLVGDWDRHEDQYSWAMLEQEHQVIYLPIPEDRDNAFFSFSGFVPWLTSRNWAARELQHFGYQISDIKGLNNAARQLDRRLLTTLSVSDWQHLADSVQMVLTDEVITAAVKKMPAAIYALSGEEIVEKLKARRQQLPAVAMQYGRLLAKYADVHGSEKQERFEVTRLPGGHTRVTVTGIDTATAGELLFYDRTFYASETKEIRLYGLGGNDIFKIKGTEQSSILVRIIGARGLGKYQYAYTALGQEPGYTILNPVNDKLVQDNTAESEADFASGELIRSPATDRFFYSRYGPAFNLLYNQNDGWVVGAGVTFRGYKFRSMPFGTEHRLLLQRSFGTGVNRVFYGSEIKNVAFDLDLVSTAWAYGPTYSMWFSGYGNNAPDAEGAEPARRVEFRNIFVTTALQKPFGSFFAAGAGPLYEYFNLSHSRNNWVEERLPPQQTKLFGQKHYLGATAYFKTSVKDNEANPTKGLVVNLQGSMLQGLHQGIGNYRRYTYDIRYFMSPSLPFQLTFAGRLGGTANRGDFSFYQGAMLGGGTLPDFSQNIRGVYRNRLVGDRSIYTNLELRASLINYRLYLFPGKAGLLTLYDTGRVYANVNQTGGWQRAYGGGAWFSLFNRIVLSGSISRSGDGAYFNLQNGFFF